MVCLEFVPKLCKWFFLGRRKHTIIHYIALNNEKWGNISIETDKGKTHEKQRDETYIYFSISVTWTLKYVHSLTRNHTLFIFYFFSFFLFFNFFGTSKNLKPYCQVGKWSPVSSMMHSLWSNRKRTNDCYFIRPNPMLASYYLHECVDF